MRLLTIVAIVLITTSCFDQSNQNSVGEIEVDSFVLPGLYESLSEDGNNPSEIVRTAMVFSDDGKYYVMRGTESQSEISGQKSFAVSEIFQGTATISDSEINSTDLHYYNPQFEFVGTGRLDARFNDVEGKIVGSVLHFASPSQVVSPRPRGFYDGPPIRGISIDVARNIDESVLFETSNFSGSYSGALNRGGTLLPAAILLGATGELSVSLEDGCRIEGTITPALGVGRIDALSSLECDENMAESFFGVVGLFGGTAIALLIDTAHESALLLYLE